MYEQRSRQHEAGTQLAGEEAAAKEVEAMQVEGGPEVLAEQAMPDVNTSGAAVGHDRPGIEGTAAQSAANFLAVSTAEEANGDGVRSSSALPEVQDEDEKGRIKKRVRFQDPWVPPHRRDDEIGTQIRCGSICVGCQKLWRKRLSAPCR